MKRIFERIRNDRGSALLASLMVMVGLSLLGLAFVAISETESSIAVNQRNATQVQQVAEAGVKLAIEWFQNPNWALAQGLMPANSNAIKPERTIDLDGPGPLSPSNDWYKSGVGSILFDQPFKPGRVDRFYGTADNPDVLIDGSTAQGFLDTLNALLFATPAETGRITSIRIYAPPMAGGSVNASGYWELGSRLGLATVEVTATKCQNDAADPCSSADSPDRYLAQKTVRAVISEWPFPGPAGPIQTNADLGTNGNLQVHWGKITATGVMDLKRPFSGLPYHDAYNKARFEFGYVDPAAGAANNPYPHDPASADFRTKYPWINDLVEKKIKDPWWEAWSRDDAIYAADGSGIGPYFPQRWENPNQAIGDMGANDACSICRTIFQYQTTNNPPDQQSVLFPRIDYSFWKDIAIAGDDQDTIFYLQWVEGDKFRDRNGQVRTIRQWLDTNADPDGVGPMTRPVPGFYFFDTMDGTDPQLLSPGDPTNLTPTFKIQGGTLLMAGFVYLNVEKFDGSGGSGPTLWYSMPGEPYRDIGFWEANDDGTDWEYVTPGVHKVTGAQTGGWEWDDVNDNGVFDYVTDERSITRANPAGTIDAYFLVPWTPGCTIGTDCSEPHEPYLNLIYEEDRGDEMTMGWEAGVGTQRAKITDDGTQTGTPIACDAASTLDECTSNGYDRDGPLVEIPALLNGVLYIEGIFEQTGNFEYYGSVLVEGDASKAGNPDVWFDERLIKGEWPPQEFNFPRVYVSSIQTD